jgi:outer membrane protein TolC
MRCKKKQIFWLLLCAIPFGLQAQNSKTMSLKDAVSLVVSQSNEVKLANVKLSQSQLEVEKLKQNQYPSAKISGQYLQLTKPNVDFAFPMSGSGNSLNVNHVLLGNLSVAMPVFSGFKLKNSIDAQTSMYESETYKLAQTKEQLALQVTEHFAQLYQTEQMISLFEENIKSATQRVTDFKNMMDNGLLARNDFLKAQLQQSNVEIALENAKKNRSIINYKLVKLLQLPNDTQITIDIDAIKKQIGSSIPTEINRSDLKSLEMQQLATEKGIQIAKGNYYPTVALTGGYVALDVQNFLTVTNAMNFGVVVSYDLAGIFKNKKEVSLAKNKAEQTQIAKAILNDKISEEIQSSAENYSLSQKQAKVYASAVEQADENYRIVKDKYDNGLVNTNDLLEADVQQLQAKVNYALSQADVALKFYEMQFAKGNLVSSLTSTK